MKNRPDVYGNMEYFCCVIMLVKDILISKNLYLENWEGAESSLARTRLKLS